LRKRFARRILNDYEPSRSASNGFRNYLDGLSFRIRVIFAVFVEKWIFEIMGWTFSRRCFAFQVENPAVYRWTCASDGNKMDFYLLFKIVEVIAYLSFGSLFAIIGHIKFFQLSLLVRSCANGSFGRRVDE
jgi:hypothetical protein